MNGLKKIGYIAALAALPFMGNGQENKQKIVEPTYNTIELAVTDKGDFRTRSINNVNFNICDKIQAWYHGLNEVDNLNEKTYSGRNWFAVGTKKDKLLVDSKSFHGAPLADVKYGITTSRLNDLTKTYGFTNVTANKNNAEAVMFFGKTLGKWSLENLADVQFNKENASLYNEAYVYRDISKNGKLKAYVANETFKSQNGTKHIPRLGINYIF